MPMTIDPQGSICSASRLVTLNWVMSRVSGLQPGAWPGRQSRSLNITVRRDSIHLSSVPFVENMRTIIREWLSCMMYRLIHSVLPAILEPDINVMTYTYFLLTSLLTKLPKSSRSLAFYEHLYK